MGHAGTMEGVLVGESEVATGLGFTSVEEFRRWQTDVGRENAELKHRLSQAKDEALRFRWSGMRGHAILQRCKTFLEDLNNWNGDARDPHIVKLLLGIGVVCGGAVDWNHELADWLDYLNPIRIKIEEDQCTLSGILDGDSRTRRTLETDLATFTGPKLTVNADHVGLVTGGMEAWLDNVPKTCRITYKMSQLGQNVYYGSDKPYETADFENPEEWGLEPAPEPAVAGCMVRPPK